MSRKGRSCDNARAEGFSGLLRQEFFRGRDWTGVGAGEFSAALDEWVRWFRSGRISQALGWLTSGEHRLVLGYAEQVQENVRSPRSKRPNRPALDDPPGEKPQVLLADHNPVQARDPHWIASSLVPKLMQRCLATTGFVMSISTTRLWQVLRRMNLLRHIGGLSPRISNSVPPVWIEGMTHALRGYELLPYP